MPWRRPSLTAVTVPSGLNTMAFAAPMSLAAQHSLVQELHALVHFLAIYGVCEYADFHRFVDSVWAVGFMALSSWKNRPIQY